MKKSLLLIAVLALGLAGFAQKPTLKKGDLTKQCVLTKVEDPNAVEGEDLNFAPTASAVANHNSFRSFDEWTTIYTVYDKQSNGSIGSRIAAWPDGTAAIVATMSKQSSGYTDRGTGYNYFDGSEFSDTPETRVEPYKTGWPSICAAGNAEILAAHSDGVNIFRRANKGEGEWEEITNLPNMTWPRIISSGNGQYVFVVGANSATDAQGNTVYENYYSRSTDGGLTWSNPTTPPMVDPADYYNNIGADDYVMASNGNDVAILFGGLTYEMFYIISHDNGETWEKQVVAEFPYGHGHDWYETSISSATDSIWWMDNSQSIAIDNNGVVHVAFGLTRWAPAPDSGYGYITYWPYTDDIVYWNSEYVNEEGGHEILRFGKCAIDAEHPEWALNGTDGVSSTLNDSRLWELAELDGHKHLHLFGWPDEDGDGVVDYSEYWDGHVAYSNYGISNCPAISIDENNNMAIVYSTLSETRVNGEVNFYYRSAYVTYRDNAGTWFDDYENLCGDFMHMLDEAYPTFAASNAYNGEFWVGYSADDQIGLLIDGDTGATDNYIYAVRITPDFEGWNVGEAVNPMTSVRVYPNPVQDVLNIEVNASQASEMSIAVYNITGQKVMETSANLSTGYNTPSVNVSNLNSGIYFATVKANGFENTVKFVVK